LRDDLVEEPIPKPIRPKPSNVRARAQDIMHFTAEKMAKYKDLRVFYTQDLRDYTSEDDKLTAARSEVFEFITPALRDLLKPDQPLR
jgi:DNA-binding PucR family transcriptional regulator